MLSELMRCSNADWECTNRELEDLSGSGPPLADTEANQSYFNMSALKRQYKQLAGMHLHTGISRSSLPVAYESALLIIICQEQNAWLQEPPPSPSTGSARCPWAGSPSLRVPSARLFCRNGQENEEI